MTSYRIRQVENIFITECQHDGDWLPIGIFNNAGTAQVLAMSLIKAREITEAPQGGEIIWSE